MMHPIQEKLLRLSQEVNLGGTSLRKIADLIGAKSPQIVKHHLNQLEKKGLIRVDKLSRTIERTRPGVAEAPTKTPLLIIPILGAANAGPATMNAEENLEGYLHVSSRIVGRQKADGLFALKVSGPSMNRASVGGKTIDDGDYVVVDSTRQSPQDGDIVLSVIDRMANVKRFRYDRENEQIVLTSESTQNFPPIYIHPDDGYLVNGEVVQVIKRPKT